MRAALDRDGEYAGSLLTSSAVDLAADFLNVISFAAPSIDPVELTRYSFARAMHFARVGGRRAFE